MKKSTVGYCWRCAKYTEQKVIECHDSTAFKIFDTIITLGFSALFPRDYNCKCTECGEINILTF